MTNHPPIAPKPMPQRSAQTARRGAKKERPAHGERLISAALLLLTVATIIGFYIQQLSPGQ